MKYLLLLITLLIRGALAQSVTVTITTPQPADVIGGHQYAAFGTSATSFGGATITGNQLFVDGTLYGATMSGTTAWAAANIDTYSAPFTAGSHTIFVRATDSLGHTGDSATVTVSSPHTSPQCTHSAIGASGAFCEEQHTGNATTSTSTVFTFPSGAHAGDVIATFAFTAMPSQQQGFLNADINNSQTNISVTDTACGGCAWPATPFTAYLSDITSSEKITVTSLGSPWTVVRGIVGNTCIVAGNYYTVSPPNGTPNTPLANGGVPETCSGPVSHLAANVVVNTWPVNLFSPGNITDTFPGGLTWIFDKTTNSGPLGDFGGFPTGTWHAVVPSTIGSSFTVTVSNARIINSFIPATALRISGLSTLRTIGIGTGFGGQGPMGSPAGSGDAQTAPFVSASGDIIIGFVAGSPTFPGPGFTEASEDATRPYLMSMYKVASSSSEKVVAPMNTEGHLAIGLSFHPLSVTAMPVLWTTTLAPCWTVNNPQIGTPWDTSGHHINKLVGTGSSGSGGLIYAWSITAGPNSPTITSPTSATTTVTGVIPGQYTAQLCVTDANGTNCATLIVGALGIDAKGIVIPTDPNITKIYGPIIAFGYNPWCYEDERNLEAILLQISNNLYSMSPPTWATTGQGTIAYQMFGRGFGNSGSPAGATLNGNTTTTALSIQIHTAQNLPSLTTLPTWLMLGGFGGEAIRVLESIGTGSTCGTGAGAVTTGDAQLCIAYDGRGISPYPAVNSQPRPAFAWTNGTVVAEFRIQGSGTLFATDSNRPVAPAGVPGPPGPVVYSTGTVAVVHNSTTITGSSTVWNSGNGVIPGDMIRISGATHSGTPFVFWREITAVGSTTSITIDHAYPNDADDLSGLSYKITGSLLLDLEFNDNSAPIYGAGNNGTYRVLVNAVGCESETACFAQAAFDISSAFGSSLQAQSGVKYSYKFALDCCGPFGPNFYGSGFAARLFDIRSGYVPALTLANDIDDYWIRDPQTASGFVGTASPLYGGGGVLGGIANLVLNGSTLLHWSDVRPWATAGVNFFNTYHSTCSNALQYDTRDQAYLQLYTTLAGVFDPSSYVSNWLVALGSAGSGAGILGRATNVCQHSDHSYAVNNIVPSVWVGNAPNRVVTLTANATTITPAIGGQTFTSNMCPGIVTGMITVTHGSANFTFNTIVGTLGTNPHWPSGMPPYQAGENYNMIIHDTVATPNYSGTYAFLYSGTTGTLDGLWAGNSGTFPYIVNDNRQGIGGPTAGGGGMIAIGSSVGGTDADNLLQSETWSCIFVDSTHMTLWRPWNDSDTGGSIHPSGTFYFYDAANFGVGPGGFYEQPFMHGINTKVMSYAANDLTNPTLTTGFAALLPGAAQWFHNTGFDPNTNGAFYTRGSLSCEPFITANPSPPTLSITGAGNTPPCGWSGLHGDPPDTNGDSEQPERVNAQESFHDVIEYKRAQCALGPTQCTAAITFGDLVYGSIWGKCSWTLGGGATYYCDSRYINITGELSNGSIGNYKWTGFFFGVGMAHQWPAERVSNIPLGTAAPSIFSTGGIFYFGGIK